MFYRWPNSSSMNEATCCHPSRIEENVRRPLVGEWTCAVWCAPAQSVFSAEVHLVGTRMGLFNLVPLINRPCTPLRFRCKLCCDAPACGFMCKAIMRHDNHDLSHEVSLTYSTMRNRKSIQKIPQCVKSQTASRPRDPSKT